MDAIRVANINERRRIPMRAIRAVVQQIAEKFQPERIILFGSYAYGRPKPESDLDLPVVMDTPLRNREQAAQIARAIDYHQPALKAQCKALYATPAWAVLKQRGSRNDRSVQST